MENFSELFEETLKDIYYAEKAILKALPKMAKKASSKKLEAAFTEHLKQTERQWSVWIRYSGSSARKRVAKIARPSTASSKKRKT